MINIDINHIKEKYPKLYITEKTVDRLEFSPEKNKGHIEYKRSLKDCSDIRIEKYATQMKWRISENVKRRIAVYFIGIDDDGTIVGLSDDRLNSSIISFVIIANTISASIIGIQIIHIEHLTIIKACVKIKNLKDDYLVEFN